MTSAPIPPGDSAEPSGPLVLLRDGRYLRLWLTGILLGTVRWLEILGVALWTLRETGSPLLVAAMYFARSAPLILLGVPMGALADRVDRRRLLLGGVAAALASAATLIALAAAGRLVPWEVALGAFVSGIVFSMEHPCRRPLIAEVVGIASLGRGLALDAATFNATRMTGPLVGGAAYAALGLEGVYAVSVVSCTIVLGALASLRVAGDGSPSRAPAPFLPGLAAGIAHVRERPVLAAVMAVTALANALAFSYSSMVPVIAKRVLALDALTTGVLMSMEGLGAFLGALTLAFVVRASAYGRVFLGGGLLVAVTVVVFSHSTSVSLSMVTLFVVGLGAAGFGSMQTTIVIANSEPAVRSRVLGVLVVCIGAGPPGVLLLGALANVVGAAAAVGLSAGVGVACVLAAAWRWPALWRR